MRRSKYVSKKLAVVLLSASMGITPVAASMAMPVISFAAEQPDNQEGEAILELAQSDEMENNDGKIVTNNGTIETNNGTVDDNNGSIMVNSEDGKVVNNNRTITENYGYVENNEMGVRINNGQVDINNGFVGKNYECVIENYGSVSLFGGYVTDNHEGGTVQAGDTNPGRTEIGSGEIVNNVGGTVYSGYNQDDVIEIENYYYGDLTNIVNAGGEEIQCAGTIFIDNSFGDEEDTDKDYVVVNKQFHLIDVRDADNVDVTYNGFTQEGAYHLWFVQTAENSQPVEITGTITLKAKDGYALSDNGQLGGEADRLVYELSRNEDGSYTVNIASLTGNVSITPEMLNLIVSEISKEHGEVTNVVVNNGSSDNSGNSDNGSGSAAEASAPASVNFNDIAIKNIADQVQAQITNAQKDATELKVVDIYFKDKIAMTPDIIKYLCEKVPYDKRCHFDYKEQEHILFIPKYDVTAPAYAEGLKLLENEPSKTAGFYRIREIFNDLKFDAKVVETPVEEKTQD